VAVTAPARAVTVASARVEGLEALRLAAGGLEATFVPAAGMVGASLRHEGEELLDVQGGVRAHLATGAPAGIPFLHPWANRLGADRYTFAGRVVDLPAGVPRDPAGLPIHGLLPGAWRIVRVATGANRATVVAARRVDDPAFPFPHRVEQVVTLDRFALTIATLVTPTADVAVPIAFGFHPYLRIPGVPRERWRLALPARRRVHTDARLIPDGRTESLPAETFPLGDRAFDDGYDGIAPGARLVVSGGGRQVTVTFVTGYPVAQLYAPPGATHVCFEPMTAPTDALRRGTGLRAIAPGARYVAAYEVRVD
jgi:aldose 1-epimerase